MSEHPDDLPVPEDDGAAAGLVDRSLPDIRLASALHDDIDLRSASSGTLVLYVYPRTGTPGQPLPSGWDEIPGARGCSAENCAFRDHESEIHDLGATVMGLSAQPPAEQREFAVREGIPYPLLNDSQLALARELGLPTFDVAGMRLYKRLTLIVENRRVIKVFYPVFPPGIHAGEVVFWLRTRDDR